MYVNQSEYFLFCIISFGVGRLELLVLCSFDICLDVEGVSNVCF